MLDRIDHHKPLEDLQFDEAVRQCLRAKNSMSVVVSGFSPEQAVLGKATRLPSIISDEELGAHLLSQGSDTASDRSRDKLALRTAARAAFSQVDNSEALRRALNHQSRGMDHNSACGPLCMYWDVPPTC